MTFTCTQCIYTLANKEELANHYTTGFHQYNVRRSLRNEPPVLFAEYESKLDCASDIKKMLMNKKSGLNKGKLRQCKRNTINLSQPSNQKSVNVAHSEIVTEEESETRIIDVQPYQDTMCLFDNQVFSSFEKHFEYLKSQYCFRIPDEQYCTDPRKLVQFLGEKIYEGLLCLYCDKPFTSVAAVQQHMADSGHRIVGTSTPEQLFELAFFYDYRDSYKNLNISDEMKAYLAEISHKLEDEADDPNEPLAYGFKAADWRNKLFDLGLIKLHYSEAGCELVVGEKVISHRDTIKTAGTTSQREDSRKSSTALLNPKSFQNLPADVRAAYKRCMLIQNRLQAKELLKQSIKNNKNITNRASSTKVFL